MIKEKILNSDCIVSFGTLLSYENSELTSLIKNRVVNGAEFIYMHPFEDENIKEICTQYIKYEVGSEEGVMALLLEFLTSNRTSQINEYIEDLDIGYISAESSAGEEEFEEMVEKSSNKSQILFLVGDDILSHERAENLKVMLKVLNDFSSLDVVFLNGEKIEDISFGELEEVEELNSYNGTIIYNIKSSNLKDDEIIGSSSFSKVAKISDGDEINIISKSGSCKKIFKLDDSLQGTISLTSTNENSLSNGYRFKQVKIEKAGV